MPVSESRIRAYKRARRAGMNARDAAWVTSKPRYEVDPYDDDQAVTVDGETFHVRIVPDEDGWHMFREDMENGFFTDDDADHVSYYVILVSHPSGVDSSLGGVGIDDREPFAERYIVEEACDVIDDVRVQLPSVARALLPFGKVA